MPWYSWGQNDRGECAQGTTSPALPAIFQPPAISLVPSDTVQVASTQSSGVARTSGGDLYVWGFHDDLFGAAHVSIFGGQFVAPTVPVSTPTKLNYANAVNATYAQMNTNAVFWLKSDNTLWAVGLNSRGAFGNGDAVDTYYALPTQIASSVASFVTADTGTTYYIDLSGNLWFSGPNTRGQQGNGATSTAVFTFASVAALSSVSRVWTGGEHTFALSGSTLYAWGYNFWGQLGIGNTTQQTSPVVVTTLPGGAVVSDVCASGSGFTYVLLADGRLYGSGDQNDTGALGTGNYTNISTFTQLTVGASLSVSALCQGGGSSPFSGAVIASGQYWASGNNDKGQVNYTSLATAYNTFENLITFPSPISAITFIGDVATFVNVAVKGRAYAYLVGV